MINLNKLANNLSTKNWIVTVVILLALDQLIKIIFVKYFVEYVFYNKGIAFSLPVGINVSVLIAGIAILGVFFLKYKKILTHDWLWAIFTAGAIGNLIDRVRIQAVIDFINLGWFPIFNIADVYLTGSAILITYFYIFKNSEK